MRLHYDMLAKSRLLGTSQLKALLTEAERQMQELDTAAQAAEAKAHSAVSALDTVRKERDEARDQIVALNQRYDAACEGHVLQVQQHEDAIARLTADRNNWANRAQIAEKRPAREDFDAMVKTCANWRKRHDELNAHIELFKRAIKAASVHAPIPAGVTEN